MPDLGQLLTSVLNNYVDKSEIGDNVAQLDANGKVPSSQLPYENATTSTAGLMSATDKTKLDGFGAATTYATEEYVTSAMANAGGGSMTEQEVAAAFQQHYGNLVCYTLAIDETNSSPGDACTYADDAFGMTKGSSDWDAMPIFKDIKPCVFKDGAVVYYLNPNNWNEKIDGTAANLTGTDGDVMIEFPKFAYRIYRNGSTLYVSITNDMWLAAIDNRFNLDAFSRLDVGDLEHFYQGAYKGYLDTDTGKLRSIAGVLPTGSKTITQFRTAAQLNGAHYQQSVYSHLKALQCLYLIKYGNRNGQTALGLGIASSKYLTGYQTVDINYIDANNSTATLGMYYGDTGNTSIHIKCFGIEDFWGNCSEFIDGLTTNGNRQILINVDYSNENNIKLNKFISQFGLYSNLSMEYIKQVRGNSSEGFLIQKGNGNNTITHWADQGSISLSNVAAFGYGSTNNTSGPFTLYLSFTSTLTGKYYGSRLTFH